MPILSHTSSSLIGPRFSSWRTILVLQYLGYLLTPFLVLPPSMASENDTDFQCIFTCSMEHADLFTGAFSCRVLKSTLVTVLRAAGMIHMRTMLV